MMGGSQRDVIIMHHTRHQSKREPGAEDKFPSVTSLWKATHSQITIKKIFFGKRVLFIVKFWINGKEHDSILICNQHSFHQQSTRSVTMMFRLDTFYQHGRIINYIVFTACLLPQHGGRFRVAF
jgi:hypothetical protein